MIYNDPKNDTQSEGITGTGGGSVTLTPPKSGMYQGISFFQDLDISGNGNVNIIWDPNSVAPVRVLQLVQ